MILPMKKWIFLPLIILLFGCREKVPETWFTPEIASKNFKIIEDACNRDDGKLWGKNLYGPLMIVDRATRKITANFPDNEGLLKGKDGIYTGSYPKEKVIYITAVKFGGKLFAISSLPPKADESRIPSRAIHGLFHLFQESIGFTSSGYNTTNMDEKNARLLIKLEWNALRKAITSGGEEQQLAIRDALIFRGANHEFYQKYVTDEIRFETYEGLATFTYLKLTSGSSEEYQRRLLEFLDRIYSIPSYSRSYGLVHGALYATLLDEKGFDFSTINSEDTDLGEKVRELYNIQLPEVCRDVAGSLAINYDVEKIHAEEAKRDEDIRERIHRQIGTFMEKPVVFLELESPYFDFEPEDIHSMDTLGTLYSRMRVSDNWGKLTVDKGGCLVSNNLKYLRITAKGFRADKSRYEGEGWVLNLNSEWEMISVGQNYFVKKIVP
jgi:hypothetical protein